MVNCPLSIFNFQFRKGNLFDIKHCGFESMLHLDVCEEASLCSDYIHHTGCVYRTRPEGVLQAFSAEDCPCDARPECVAGTRRVDHVCGRKDGATEEGFAIRRNRSILAVRNADHL